MKKYKIRVYPDSGSKSKVYTVSATTEDDARQLAFALDGGWNAEEMPDASEMLSLAQCYTEVVGPKEPELLTEG